MDVIELERWKPSKADPRKLEYAGQPTAQEVFEELKHRLESTGYLPDEYFLMDDHWKDGREIPKGADIFCTTDYGSSEGIYVDVYLKWYEDGRPITKSFITGKTLGENGNDLDRMFLTAFAITKAFHGDHAGELRIKAAKRPGVVGRQMTLLLLESGKQFPGTAYRTACEKAIDINDPKKVSFLLEQADSYAEGLSPYFHGEMASYAYLEHHFIAKEIIRHCTNEQIAAAPPYLLEQFAMDSDYRTMSALVEKGISSGDSAARTIHMLTYQKQDRWMAEELLKKRMWVSPDDYSTLHTCVQNDAVGVGKLLLDGGGSTSLVARNHYGKRVVVGCGRGVNECVLLKETT